MAKELKLNKLKLITNKNEIIIYHVIMLEQPINAQRIAKILEIDKSTVYSNLNLLEKKKLIYCDLKTQPNEYYTTISY